MKPSLFPRDTAAFGAFELSAWRRLTLRLVPIAAITGVLIRGLRALALTQDRGMAVTAAAFAVGAAVLLGALTLHLANFPVRRWLWRVPAFAAAEAAAELLVSVALVQAGREPLGTTGRAAWGDVPSMALTTLEWRLVPLALFALLLAGVVQVVRRLLPRHARQHAAPPP